MAFSATNAATEGFRIVRREPWTVASWAAVVFVFSLASTVLMIPLMGPMLAGMTSAQPVPQAQALARLGDALKVEGVFVPIALISIAVFSCAVYRAVLRPDDRRFARLRIGGDELRMVLLMVVVSLIALVGFVVLVVVLVVVGGVAVALTKASNGVVMVVTVVVVYGAMLWGFIWLGVRLSLAGPMTFAQRRLRITSAWKLTRGRFWPLLGSYLLAFAFLLILYMVAFSFYGVIGFAAGGGSIANVATSLLRPNYSSLRAFFTPTRVIYQVVGALVGAVICAVYFAPAAAAYKAIAETSPDNQAAAFD